VSAGPLPPGRVPTLTEVVAWPESQGEPSSPVPAEADMVDIPMQQGSPGFDPNQDRLVERVFAEIQRQLDLMLEYRMRELLTPILARAADSLVREARSELASTLREVVTRAVAQELARHRNP
jgi:hypothetical protein